MNQSPPSSRPLLPWLLGLLLIAAVIFSYQPAWRAGFIWDDDEYVTHNPLLPAPDGLWRIWFSSDSPSQYFPLTYTTLRLEYSLWELNPTGYHWVNILLHAVNALLVWRLLKRLALPGAWLAAAIFALHPVQVESVAWITELKNVQSLFFFLLATLAWLEFTDGRQPAWRWYALALIFHTLALLSKTTACTLPAALILTLWLKHQPVSRTRWVQVMPFVWLSLAMGLLTIWWERHHQGTSSGLFSYGLADRTLIASHALWFYLGKLVWPVEFIFSYPLWTINPADLLAYGWSLAAALFAGVLYFFRPRTGRGPSTAFVFFVAMLSPLLGFIMLYTFKYTFVADHYQYVAMLGPAALAAAALHSGCARFRLPRFVFPALATALLLCLASLTWQQAHMYLDLETLWRTTVLRNPQSHIGHNNLSVALLAKGEAEAAAQHAQQALALDPPQSDRALAHINLGNALLQQGHVDDAIAHLQQAVEIQPDLADAHNNLGSAWRSKGQIEKAIIHFKDALTLNPTHANAHYNLANAYYDLGSLDDAIRHYQASLAGNPNDPDTHTNLASTFLRQNRPADALTHASEANRLTAGENPVILQILTETQLANAQPTQAAASIALALKLLETQPNPDLQAILQSQLARARAAITP
jgi:tetratricopeptide (TPR) repeat protein